MDQEQQVKKFVEVTGESEETAKEYLKTAEGNVESAISLLFEGKKVEAAAPEPEPEVRAPILPTQEVLVPPSSPPTRSSNIFDGFRNFALETRLQEAELCLRAAGKKSNLHNRRPRHLEDLYRPPWDIAFLGAFVEAQEYAKIKNRWLLVDVQNHQEFACQILNRDLWSHKQIREILKDHFILWQTSSVSNDGIRFVNLYKVTSYPHVTIIDPRTGECIKTFNTVTVDGMISSLNDILSLNPSPDINGSDLSDGKALDPNLQIMKLSWEHDTKRFRKKNAPGGSNSSSTAGMSKRSRLDRVLMQEDENFRREQQPPVASAPLSQPATAPTPKPEGTKTKEDETSENEPSVRLCLRLPDGSKKSITMPSNQKVETFFQKMADMGFLLTTHTFSIPISRVNVGELSPTACLRDTLLFPSNTVIISRL